METTYTGFIRSLRNEAGRQADFFATRDEGVSSLWTEVETIAQMALAKRTGLRLILCEQLKKDPIIKGGE